MLAHQTRLRCADDPAPLGLPEALAEDAPGCAHVHFNPCGEAAFVAATPEQPSHRTGRMVESEGLAGTRRRGATGAEDALPEHALRRSAKDEREPSFVELSLRTALARLTCGGERDAVVLALKRASVQNLRRGAGGSAAPCGSDLARPYGTVRSHPENRAASRRGGCNAHHTKRRPDFVRFPRRP